MNEVVSSASVLADAVMAINRRMHRVAHDEMARHSPYPDLRVFDFIVLRTISRHPGVTIKQLSERLGLAHSTVSSMLQRYDQLGLVEKSPGDKDRRAVSLAVTDAWRTVQATLLPSVEAAYAELIGRLTPYEQNALAEGLTALMRALQEDLAGGPYRRALSTARTPMTKRKRVHLNDQPGHD